MRRARAGVAAALALALCGALAACGSSSSSGGGAGSAAADGGTLSAAQVKTLLGYTNGSHAGAADAKKSPVEIGFINQQGGAGGFPTFGPQFKAAIHLINTQMGGIDGHPVKVSYCYVVSSEEEGLKCGQQFANVPGMTLVVEGALNVGAASMHSVLDRKGIPVIGALGLDASDITSSTSFFTSAGAFGTVPDYVKYAQQYLHAKKVALLTVQGNAVSQLVGREVAQGFKLAHIKVTSSSFQQGQTDVVGPLSAAGAQDADLIIPLAITPEQCLGTANTLKTLNIHKPVLALYGCATESLKEQFGDYPTWTYAAGYVSELAPPANATERNAIDAYHAWFKPIAAGGDKTSGVIMLQSALQAVNFLNGGGGSAATPRKVVAYGRKWRGPIFLGPPVHYGFLPALPAEPSLALRFYTYDGNGKWVDSTGGKWLSGTLGA